MLYRPHDTAPRWGLCRFVRENLDVKSLTVRQQRLWADTPHAILAGTLQISVSMDTLRKELPLRWADQKKLFGVE